MPVPLTGTDCGLPLALLAIVTAAVRVPVPVGVNVTSIVQTLWAVSTTGQLLLCEKSPALAPLMPMPASVRLPVPVFVTVTLRDVLFDPTLWLAKDRLAGDTPSAGQSVVQTFVRNASPNGVGAVKDVQLLQDG